jgi:hypothetical protein
VGAENGASGRLRRLGFWLTGDWGEAEELAQEPLVRTYGRWLWVRRHDRPEDSASSNRGGRDQLHAGRVLALTLLVPRMLADRRQLADRPQPLPKSLVTISDQGFQLQVPDGWKVRERDGQLGLLLVPTRPSSGPLPATIMVHTGVLDPLIYPGPRPSAPSDSPVPTWEHPVPGGPFTQGRRSDGRWYVRSDHANQLAGAWAQRYELAWPYQCALGARCPWEARYRGLVVEAASPRGEQAATQAVLRRIMEAARPVGNAVAPEPVAARRLCRIPDQRLHSSPDVELGRLVPAAPAGQAGAVGGRPARQRGGNGSIVELDGAMPEGRGALAGSPRPGAGGTGAADPT